MSNTMAINKKLLLAEEWTVSDLVDFVNKLDSTSLAINKILNDPNLVVDSILFDITVNVRQAEKDESLKLDDDFWVAVANGEYNE